MQNRHDCVTCARVAPTDPHPDRRVPKLLRLARKRLGWSQPTLAHAAGVHPTTVSWVEQGRLTPSVSLLRRLATCLRVDMEHAERAWLSDDRERAGLPPLPLRFRSAGGTVVSVVDSSNGGERVITGVDSADCPDLDLDPADEFAMRLLPEAFDHSMSVNKGRG